MPPARVVIFIGLNIIRLLSVIILILVFSSSIVVLARDVQAVNKFMAEAKISSNSTIVHHTVDCDYIEGSTVPNQPAGAFWAVVNRLFIICQVVVLILSEMGWPAAFFDQFFPVLGKSFGTGALGIFQCLIGAAILSHFVDEFSLVSAFFLFALGWVNIITGLIWAEKVKSKRSLTSWRDYNKKVLPVHSTGSSFHSTSSWGEKNLDINDESLFMSSSTGRAAKGFGRQGEKAAALKGFSISPPTATLPKYVPPPRVSGSATSITLVSPGI